MDGADPFADVLGLSRERAGPSLDESGGFSLSGSQAPAVAMLPKMLEDCRQRAGWSVARAAWELGVSIREYRQLEAGTAWPSSEVWHRICDLFGWPQTFASGIRR